MRRSSAQVLRIYLHDSWVDEVHVTLQALGERVRQRADELFVGVLVCEGCEICVKQAICLANGNVDADPVACRGDRGRVQPVLLQP